jgi:hypothetical protein
MQSEILNLWPTEVMLSKIPSNIVDDLVSELLVNVDVSSLPGDVSDGNLNTNEYLDRMPVLKNFYKTVVPELLTNYCKQVHEYELKSGQYTLKSWINNGSGRYSLGFHNHSGAQLSAVLYLISEETDRKGGQIRFHDPRFNANRGLVSKFKEKHNDFVVAPMSGDFIIMPSYLYHSVTPFHGITRLVMPIDIFIND